MSGADAGGRPGERGADTRTRILRIAAELFARRGYGGTSMRDIAERLGTSKQALAYWFPHKEDLLAALVEPTIGALDAVLDRAEAERTPPEPLLRAFLAATIGTPGLAAPMDVPGVLQADDRYSVSARLDRLAGLLAGPGAGADQVLRAHAAIGALQSGLQAAARVGPPPSDSLSTAIDVLVPAAIAALGRS